MSNYLYEETRFCFCNSSKQCGSDRMIVWLASYPRSGNSLVRDILKQCAGINSYSLYDFRDPDRCRKCRVQGKYPEELSNLIDHSDAEEPLWPRIYTCATRSREVYVIKTHEPPIDAQPVVYVQRDGRKAIISYLNYLEYWRKNIAGRTERSEPVSLLEILIGSTNLFGNWSEHHGAWADQGRGRLNIRYEEVVEISPAMLQTLIEFVCSGGGVNASSAIPDISPWINNFTENHARRPHIYREGIVDWNPPAEWTRAIDRLFWRIHGTVMQATGYVDHTPATTESSRLNHALNALIRDVRCGRVRERSIQRRLKRIEDAEDNQTRSALQNRTVWNDCRFKWW